MATMVSMPAALPQTDGALDPAALAGGRAAIPRPAHPATPLPGRGACDPLPWSTGRSTSWGALPIPSAARPVCSETLFPLFSGTKPFASVALWQQIERGRLDLGDPVAAYWPAFGQNGKERVLVRHVLSHRAGFPTTPPDLPRGQWGDRTSDLGGDGGDIAGIMSRARPARTTS